MGKLAGGFWVLLLPWQARTVPVKLGTSVQLCFVVFFSNEASIDSIYMYLHIRHVIPEKCSIHFQAAATAWHIWMIMIAVDETWGRVYQHPQMVNQELFL